MNNVIKKMAQFEQKEIATKLASHNVHLSITDDMKKLYPVIEKNYVAFKNAKSELRTIAATLNGLGATMQKDAANLIQLNQKFELMANELGIDPYDSEVYQNSTDVDWNWDDVDDTLAALKNIK